MYRPSERNRPQHTEDLTSGITTTIHNISLLPQHVIISLYLHKDFMFWLWRILFCSTWRYIMTKKFLFIVVRLLCRQTVLQDLMRKYNGCNCRHNKTKEKPFHVGTSPHVREAGTVQIVALVIRNTGYRLHPSKFYGQEFPSATHDKHSARQQKILLLLR